MATTTPGKARTPAGSNEPSVSPRDIPLWMRGVSAGLFLFASWWVLDTEAIRAVVGDSVAALCLGVISLSILQGMHLPLGIWSDGPWRRRFSTWGVVATAVGIALSILVSKATHLDILVERLDLGAGIAVIFGAVGLSFAVGFVKHKRYLAWYAAALVLGLLPLLGGLITNAILAEEVAVPVCLLSMSAPGVSDTAAAICGTPLVPSIVFLTGIGAALKLATEEMAFRRLLIGSLSGAGLLSVLLSGLVAMCWYALLSRSGVVTPGAIAWGTVGAVSAGCIYVLARSLIASALLNAVHTAGFVSLVSVSTLQDAPGAGAVSATMLLVASLVGLALATIVGRRNGIMGNMRFEAFGNATRN